MLRFLILGIGWWRRLCCKSGITHRQPLLDFWHAHEAEVQAESAYGARLSVDVDDIPALVISLVLRNKSRPYVVHPEAQRRTIK